MPAQHQSDRPPFFQQGAPQCAQHDMFERFWLQGAEDLKQSIRTLADAMAEQSKVHSEMVTALLTKQGTQQETCGKRGAEIKNLQGSDAEQWLAINDLRKARWQTAGAVAAAAFIGTVLAPLVPLLFKFIQH